MGIKRRAQIAAFIYYKITKPGGLIDHRSLIVKSKINPKQNRLEIKDKELFSNDRLVLPSNFADEFGQYLHTITVHAGSQ